MNAERWREVKRIFDAALDVESDRRAEWLAAEAGGDAAVQREVERLLAVDSADISSEILDDGVPEEMLAPASSDGLIGRRIGRFTISRVLGAGGMGTVYEAVQDRPQRIVALKILRLGLHGVRAKQRFEYEAEVLGRLRHPGIAQIVEAGTHREGAIELPYFAMEWVEDGMPLDRFVRVSQLDTAALLGLFCQVCDAVHYGHQRGVIHRDLKPANILVDKDGRPKVIDFGIARTIDADGVEMTRRTETGQIVGTLQYMSPEQLDGTDDDIDTTTDVYALGTILYELLTGELPFALAGLPLTTAARKLRSEEPPRPSTHKRTVRPDLDWIVVKAMDKVPDRRYASASELAGDIGRFLRGEPVVAGPPSAAYRVRRFVARNRLAVAAGALTVLALTGGMVAAEIGRQRAVRAEQLAEERRVQAELGQQRAVRAEQLAEERRVQVELEQRAQTRVSHFQREILTGVNSLDKGRDVRLADVLDAAAASIGARRFEEEPFGFRIRNVLGISYFGLGLQREAREQLEEALRLAEKHVGHDHAETFTIMASLASLESVDGSLDEAHRLGSEAVAGLLKVRGPDNVLTANARGNLAAVLMHMGDYRGAEEHFRGAIDTHRRLFDDISNHVIQRAIGLAVTLSELGRIEEANAQFARARNWVDLHLSADHPIAFDLENNYAIHLRRHGQPQQFLAAMEDLLERTERLRGKTHRITLALLNNVATAHQDLGAFEEAERTLRIVLERYRVAGGQGQFKELVMRHNLAVVLRKQGKLTDAIDIYDGLRVESPSRLPRGHWLGAVFRKGYGDCLLAQGDFERAETELLAAANSLEASLGAEHRRTQKTYEALVELYEAWGKPESRGVYAAKLAAPGAGPSISK